MLIILLVLFCTFVAGILAILTLLSSTTNAVEYLKRFALRQYDRVTQFVKWLASQPIAIWPVVLGGACLAVRISTLICPKGILHIVWGDWAHTTFLIPLSDAVDALILFVRKQHPILRFLINLYETLLQLAFTVAIAAIRMVSSPDVPLTMLWAVVVPTFASVSIWTIEASLPKRWRYFIMTDRDGGERPIEGLRNKILIMCGATLVTLLIAIIITTKTAPTRMVFLGGTDVPMLFVIVTVALLFTTVLMSIQVDGDTVEGNAGRRIFWNQDTVYSQYHYTLFVACSALAMILILIPSINTALFAYRRLSTQQ